ncbi:MAG: VWA domain-containing protein [Acidobacteriaceae bacterium]|nr:VWA domain-containing protein [Acidobacteriaceae bacterium]MBV9307246.1 VWA domain-containing protein [Acidobacteriaceae bacterium]
MNITAVVRSQQGELMDQLTQDDFEVLEDGVPQKIQFFARKTELPLSVGILVDSSDSQKPFLKQHYRDLSIFLEQVLRPSDQAFVVCFDNHLWRVSNPTSSMLTISLSLQRFARGDRRVPELGPHETRELGTALYDALYFSVTEKLDRAGERCRALLVFSDGEENSSEHDLLDAIAVAQQTNTLIYSIRYTHQERGA